MKGARGAVSFRALEVLGVGQPRRGRRKRQVGGRSGQSGQAREREMDSPVSDQ